MIDSSIYTPSEWGKKVHSLTVDQCLAAGAAGPGKALALDTEVPTSEGIKSFGEIVYGDILFDRFGNQTKVLAVTETWHDRQCYSLTIGKQKIVASDNHLWVVTNGRILTTEQIWNSEKQVNIPKSNAIKLPEKQFNVDPYVAGISLFRRLKEDPNCLAIWNFGIITEINKTKHRDGFKFLAGGLIRFDKFDIPLNPIPEYMLGSINQRLAFISGVIDSHENIDAIFRNDENAHLTKDFFYLAASCGLNPTVESWRTYDNPKLVFTTKNKVLGRVSKYSFRTINKEPRYFQITSCSTTDSVPVRCIQVEGDGTFLITRSCIPTHNSLVLLMDPMEQVMIEHWRCTQEFPKDIDPKLQQLIQKHPLRWGHSEGRALHLRRTTPQLKETINRSRRIFKQIDENAQYYEKTNYWKFSSGFEFQFGHCEHKHSYEDHVSQQYTHVAFDELIQFFQEQYDQIDTRIRTGDPVLRYFLKNRAASNPMMGGKGNAKDSNDNPYWVREYFVDPAPEGNKILRKKIPLRDGSIKYKERIYVPATLYDNPDKEFVRIYEAQLLDKPKHIRDCYLYGKWDTIVGSHFGNDFFPDFHVRKPFRIPEHWPIFRSMDWGYKTNGNIQYFAVDEEGRLYVWYEFVFKNKSAKWVAKELIRPFEEKNKLWDSSGSKIMGPADTQLWEERGESHQNKAMDMADEGVNWVRADKRDRGANATRVSERLVDHDNFTKPPMLVFFSNCATIIKVLPAMETDPHDPEAPQKGGNDHPYDATSYGVAYAQQTGLTAPERRGQPLNEYDEDDIDIQNSRGRFGWGGYD